MNNPKIGKWFYLSEIACKCEYRCTHKYSFYGPLIGSLDMIRDEIDAPIIITSGNRCARHNDRISKAKNSRHVKKMAADIYCKGKSIGELLKVIETIIPNNRGIIVHDTFIHLDLRAKNYFSDLRKK
jgi:uncharacterized protein YcbK (DUF882 family)